MLTPSDSVTPEILTTLLHEAGHLPTGTVHEVHQHTNPAFNSRVTHLRLVYGHNAPVAAPRHVLLKLNSDHVGKHEVLFYQMAAGVSVLEGVVPRCFAAKYDEATGNSLLLLQDYSETHQSALTREEAMAGEGVLPENHWMGIMVAMARFHAAWWQHPQMGKVPDLMEVRWWYRDEAFFQRHHTMRQEQVADFLVRFGGNVEDEIVDLIQNMMARYAAFWEYLAPRVTSFQHLTLSQGDCYLTQFLVPRNEANNAAVLVDFQAASVNFGAYDLVYMLATFWTSAQRAVHEAPALQLYWETLVAQGVVVYEWETLLQDYKMMLGLMLFDPIQDAVQGSSAAYWQPKLRCLVAACREWGWE